MSDLPQGWIQPAIGDVCEINPRKDVALAADDSVSFVPMAAVDEVSGRIVAAVARPYREIAKGFTQFRNNDVIFAKITPSMENGKSAVARNLTNSIGIGSTEFHVFRGFGAIEPDYLWRFVRQKRFREDAKAVMSGAVGQQRVPTDYLAAHPIPLPPLAEQRRIVAKLDGLTERTARARADLFRIPTLVTRYKQRLLALAFSGELTAAWRDHNNVPSASTVKLKTLCVSLTDGDHQAPPRAEAGVPFITISAMNSGKIDLSKATRSVPKSYFNELKESRLPRRGDVLFSVTGSIGIPALVETDDDFVFQRHIAILKPQKDKIDSRLLCYMLASPAIKEQVDAVATGTAQLTVPLGGLRDFLVPLPDRSEQAEIVRRIESAFGWLDRVAADHAAVARLLPKLDAAILAKAFRGSLVPQDPNDEPASVLLDRIRAERAWSPTKRRGRPPRVVEATGTAAGKTMVRGVGRAKRAGARPVSTPRDQVKGQPYLTNILKTMDGRAKPEALFLKSDLNLVDFYRQLSDEHDCGWLVDDNHWVRAA